MPPTYLTALSRWALLRQTQNLHRTPFPITTSTRQFSVATSRFFPQDPEKNQSSQRAAQEDRKKMDTEANEYSKSGTDSATAGQEDAAFDPNSSNAPEDEKKMAGKGNDVNPLEASPANQEMSQHTSEQSSGAGKKGGQGGGDSSGDKTG